ncbi:hypothetical protein HDU99_004911, partial [Rhizoclosmatium hyalinum]
TIKEFVSANDGNPFVDCSDSRNVVWPPVVVCIASTVFQDEKGNAVNATTGAKIILPGGNSANTPTWNGTLPIRKNGTNSTNTSLKQSVTVNINATAGTDGAVPTDATTTISTDPVPQTTDTPAVPSTPQGSGSPCSIYDGSCIAMTASDAPPNYRGYDASIECTALANYARQHYNPGVWDLVWDANLQPYAMRSAIYSATYECSECHTESGSGYSWGQNLYLSMCSCSDAYFGWVTNEAAGQDPANPEEGHFTNIVGFAVPYQTIACGSTSVNGVCSTVCDYGLYPI